MCIRLFKGLSASALEQEKVKVHEPSQHLVRENRNCSYWKEKEPLSQSTHGWALLTPVRQTPQRYVYLSVCFLNPRECGNQAISPLRFSWGSKECAVLPCSVPGFPHANTCYSFLRSRHLPAQLKRRVSYQESARMQEGVLYMKVLWMLLRAQGRDFLGGERCSMACLPSQSRARLISSQRGWGSVKLFCAVMSEWAVCHLKLHLQEKCHTERMHGCFLWKR